MIEWPPMIMTFGCGGRSAAGSREILSKGPRGAWLVIRGHDIRVLEIQAECQVVLHLEARPLEIGREQADLVAVAREAHCRLESQPQLFEQPDRGFIVRRCYRYEAPQAEGAPGVRHDGGRGLSSISLPPEIRQKGKPDINVFQGVALDQAADPDRGGVRLSLRQVQTESEARIHIH